MGEIHYVPKIDIDTVEIIDAMMENDRLDVELAELILERERAIALYNAALDRLVQIQENFENLQIGVEDAENEVEAGDRQTQAMDSQENDAMKQEDTIDDKENHEE